MAGRLDTGHRWMNEFEIDQAVKMCGNHPVLREATEFLAGFRDEVNGHSDGGWHAWQVPARAAGQLMDLIAMPLGTADGCGGHMTASSQGFGLPCSTKTAKGAVNL